MSHSKRRQSVIPENVLEDIVNREDFGNSSEIDELRDDEHLADSESVPVVSFTGDDEFRIQIMQELHVEDQDKLPPVAVKKSRKENKFQWHKTDKLLETPPESFVQLPPTAPLSPFQYFSNFFPYILFEDISNKSNIYHMQTTGKVLNTNTQEIQKLIGMHVEMGTLKFPNIRLYWNSKRRYPLIADAMTFNRFVTLRQNLHCVDNLQHDGKDNNKFWKVQPIFDAFSNVLLQNPPLERKVCVDEQMIPFKGHLAMKQYMKGKPNPWGIKMFFLCGQSGIPYSFIPYQGRSTGLPDEYNELGQSGAIVMTLVENCLQPFSDYRLFCDNYFTSPALVKHLLYHGIFYTGTVRTNRVGGQLPLTPPNLFKKKPRGTMEGCSTKDGSMCLLKWNDNSIVTMISSAYDWKEPTGKVPRWNKDAKAKTEIECPLPVMIYNKSMGGVDKLDFLMSLYRIHLKSRKWTLRVIFHFVDLTVVTSWLQYKRDCTSIGFPLKQQLTLLNFRLEISEALIKSGHNPLLSTTPGRPRTTPQYRPINDVRLDGIGHFPTYSAERLRCKYKNCGLKHYSHIICEKCNASLCLNKERNCFREFHK